MKSALNYMNMNTEQSR